jgi:DNA-binding GntR family transcriptional regulator
VHEKYEARRLMEEYAARCASSNLNDGDLKALHGACDAMAEAVSRKDLEGFYISQYAFHRAIVALARNGTLLRLWDMLGTGIGSLMMLNLYFGDADGSYDTAWSNNVALSIVDSHRAMIAVLAGPDREAAVTCVHEHLLVGERSVLRALELAHERWRSGNAQADAAKQRQARTAAAMARM